jgi:hypothetical protein
MIKVRIESIYGVALSKFLQDAGLDLEIVSPSIEQQEILGMEPKVEIHDINISDLEDRSGVQIQGDMERVGILEKYLRDNLTDVVIHKHLIQKDSIYVATIERFLHHKNLVILNLGETNGILFTKGNDRKYTEGEKIIVQVKELPIEADKLPVCSDQINLSGKYVILEKSKDNNFVRISKKIKGEMRDSLHALGKKHKPENFGMILRTSASESVEENIVNEINELVAKWENIENEKNNTDIKQIISGETVIQVIFCYNTRLELDEIFKKVTLIIPNYHNFKSYSMATGYTVEFGNNFVNKENEDAMTKTLREMIYSKDYSLDTHLRCSFLKLDGSIVDEVFGNIKSTNNDVFYMRNVLDERRADMDGSNYILYENDYIDVYVKPGSWTIYYQYYSGEDNTLLGERVRLVTPVDLIFRGKFRTVDLGINIYLANEDDNEIDVIDDNADYSLKDKGLISNETDQKIGNVISQIINQLKKNEKNPVLINM